MPWPRVVRLALAALLVVAVALLAGYLYLRSRGNQLLQDAGQAWLTRRITALSDSTYAIRLYGLRYLPPTRSLRFDSLVMATRVVRNQALARPNPTLTLSVFNGRVTRIDMWEVVFTKRIHAGEVGFDSVAAIVVLPPLFRDSADASSSDEAPPDPSVPRDTTGSGSVVVVGVDSGWVRGASLATVERVRFGNISGRLVVPLVEGRQELELRNLSVELDAVSFDPRREATTPFRVKDVRVDARSFAGELGSSRLAFTGLAGSFADSTLQVDSLRLEPQDGDSGFREGRRYRGTRLQLALHRFAAQGLDWNGFLRGTHVGVRRIELTGLDLDLLLDKRLPRNPVRRPRPSMQQFVALLREPLHIDSILLLEARLQYAERASGADRPGRIRFEHINGAISNLTNDPVLQSDSTPLRFDARAKLMGAGALDAVIEIPLLAPGYDGRYRVRVGRMDATHLNELIVPLAGAEIKEGEVTSLELVGRVHDGVYAGTFVPQFRGLGVRFPQSASQKRRETGIGGFFKGIGRGLKGMAANVVVRTNNPSSPGQRPASGRLHHVRRPWESFWSGIWQSLKPALKEAIYNVKL
jgi:hypothetical protein